MRRRLEIIGLQAAWDIEFETKDSATGDRHFSSPEGQVGRVLAHDEHVVLASTDLSSSDLSRHWVIGEAEQAVSVKGRSAIVSKDRVELLIRAFELDRSRFRLRPRLDWHGQAEVEELAACQRRPARRSGDAWPRKARPASCRSEYRSKRGEISGGSN